MHLARKPRDSQRLHASGQDIMGYSYGSEEQQGGDNHFHISALSVMMLDARSNPGCHRANSVVL